ncbi:DUF4913 domain-containing protein [Streptomyces sp. TLI_146]|uniref:DUF4913 domain-containing protein n=1 Tax=Streptomyces sp. TLI_146 TaxID=1938858 RepID=UPI000CAF9DD4|nr:DUF4913 domain-containing protein [Streptomyces sp. TLI_146]PKV84292.1 uncharacterized protein DUF4913 [Streptomyces sp. TLI_146]
MPESIDLPDDGEREPVRLPASKLESVEATVRKLMEDQAEHARQLDALSMPPESSPFAAFGLPSLPGMPGAPLQAPPEPRPILELEGDEYEDELDALSDWVDGYLIRIYGAEVTTAAPWCKQWQEHDDVVAWLHALWMAYQQHKDPEAGPSAMFVWHRDFLTHCLAHVRAAGGPLSACQTDPDRDAHRLLPGPASSNRSARTASADQPEPGEPDQAGA